MYFLASPTTTNEVKKLNPFWRKVRNKIGAALNLLKLVVVRIIKQLKGYQNIFCKSKPTNWPQIIQGLFGS